MSSVRSRRSNKCFDHCREDNCRCDRCNCDTDFEVDVNACEVPGSNSTQAVVGWTPTTGRPSDYTVSTTTRNLVGLGAVTVVAAELAALQVGDTCTSNPLSRVVNPLGSSKEAVALVEVTAVHRRSGLSKKGSVLIWLAEPPQP